MAPRRAAVVGEGRSEGEISGAFAGDEVAMVMMSMLIDNLRDVYVIRQLGSVTA
jgi:hypothetical protein